MTVAAKGNPETISQWWDGLEWHSYTPLSDKLSGCADPNMLHEGMCALDLWQYNVSEALGMDWLYKIVGNVGSQVRIGIDTELQNALDILTSLL